MLYFSQDSEILVAQNESEPIVHLQLVEPVTLTGYVMGVTHSQVSIGNPEDSTPTSMPPEHNYQVNFQEKDYHY